MIKKTDVAIIGSGPAGTATALFLERLGIQATIVEKEAFPRFHIGESMTGEAGKMIRTLGLEEAMLERSYPLKYGVNVYAPQGKQAFWIPVQSRSEAGLQDSSTWQVRRSDFDKLLLDTATARGVNFVQGQALAPIYKDNGAVGGITINTTTDAIQEIHSEVLVDASGASTFLSRVGVTGKKERGNYTNQVAIFAHVTGAVRSPGKEQGNTLIFYKKNHHWAWFIPIDDEVVSIGVVVPADYFTVRKESKHDFFVRELREMNANLASRLTKIQLIEEVRTVTNYSYHIKQFTGPGFLCVGDSHRFIDPIFSFGLHFAISEGRMAAESIAAHLNSSKQTPNPFAAYAKRAEGGQDVIQTLIDAFWNHPLAFGYLVHQCHPEDFIDLFAGRVYLDEPNLGLLDMYKLISQAAHSESEMSW